MQRRFSSIVDSIDIRAIIYQKSNNFGFPIGCQMQRSLASVIPSMNIRAAFEQQPERGQTINNKNLFVNCKEQRRSAAVVLCVYRRPLTEKNADRIDIRLDRGGMQQSSAILIFAAQHRGMFFHQFLKESNIPVVYRFFEFGSDCFGDTRRIKYHCECPSNRW